MAESQVEPISQELDELTCDAIGMALDKLAMGDGIWPTLVVANEKGERECFVFEDDGLDVCLIEARASVRELGHDATRYALYYDGFFEDEDGLTDSAMVVEFGERGMRCAYSAVVAYGNPGDPEHFWYDEPLPGGEETLLF
ncbi:MAG: hypothetical protein K6G78_03325 [bacterium]|nr:hypothetical protein [bacterium]